METEQASYHQLLAGWRPAGQPLGRRAGRWRFLLARRVKERKAGEGWRAGGHGRKRKGKKAERRKGSGRVRRALKNPPVGCRFCFGGRARCSLLGMGWRGGETGPALRRAATRSELGAGGAVTRAAIVRVCGARGTGLVRLPGAEGGAVAAGGVVRLECDAAGTRTVAGQRRLSSLQLQATPTTPRCVRTSCRIALIGGNGLHARHPSWRRSPVRA